MAIVPMIEARELYRFYHIGDDETQALRGVSMQVNPGEIVAVDNGDATDHESLDRKSVV